MAQETQYAILMYNFGITYSATRGVRSITREDKGLTRIHARLADISHGRALNHVAHCKALDRLVFGDAPRAVGAAHEADVATSLFVAPAVSSFLGLFARVSTVKRGSIHANVLPSILSNRLFLALDGSPARTHGRYIPETGLTMLQSPECLDGCRSSSRSTPTNPHRLGILRCYFPRSNKTCPEFQHN